MVNDVITRSEDTEHLGPFSIRLLATKHETSTFWINACLKTKKRINYFLCSQFGNSSFIHWLICSISSSQELLSIDVNF